MMRSKDAPAAEKRQAAAPPPPASPAVEELTGANDEYDEASE